MISHLEDLADEVLPQNTKRVKYFCGMLKRLKLIDIYEDVLDSYGEDTSEDGPYAALDRLRIPWRHRELAYIKANLERTQYRLQGIEAVAVVTNGCRLEQVGNGPSLDQS